MNLLCKRCARQPSEIQEYVDAAQAVEDDPRERDYYNFEMGIASPVTPDDYVWANEGTLNKQTGYFFCTTCYVDLGMPLGVA